jgi:hypothetical protein
MLNSFPRFFSGREGCCAALGAARLFVLYVWCVGSGSLFFFNWLLSTMISIEKNNVPDVCGHTYNTKSMTEKNGGTGLPGLRWPVALAGGISFPIFLQGRGRGFAWLYFIVDVLLCRRALFLLHRMMLLQFIL